MVPLCSSCVPCVLWCSPLAWVPHWSERLLGLGEERGSAGSLGELGVHGYKPVSGSGWKQSCGGEEQVLVPSYWCLAYKPGGVLMPRLVCGIADVLRLWWSSRGWSDPHRAQSWGFCVFFFFFGSRYLEVGPVWGLAQSCTMRTGWGLWVLLSVGAPLLQLHRSVPTAQDFVFWDHTGGWGRELRGGGSRS